MRGTIADPLTAPEAARMAESIRAVFNANAKALKLLPQSGRRFSLRQWVEQDDRLGLDGVHLGPLCRHERVFAAAHRLARYWR